MSTATATAVSKGVPKDVLYLNAWWSWNLAVAVALAANSDTACLSLQPPWSTCYDSPLPYCFLQSSSCQVRQPVWSCRMGWAHQRARPMGLPVQWESHKPYILSVRNPQIPSKNESNNNGQCLQWMFKTGRVLSLTKGTSFKKLVLCKAMNQQEQHHLFNSLRYSSPITWPTYKASESNSKEHNDVRWQWGTSCNDPSHVATEQSLGEKPVHQIMSWMSISLKHLNLKHMMPKDVYKKEPGSYFLWMRYEFWRHKFATKSL